MKRGEEPAERSPLRQLREGIDVLREALAAIAELAVRPRHVGVHAVDVARKQAARMDVLEIGALLLAVVVNGVPVRHLVRAEDIVRILRDLRLQRGHAREAFALENLRQKVDFAAEDHRLVAEVLVGGPFRQELRHEVDAASGRFREAFACAGQDRGADEDGDIRQLLDEIRHQGQVLRAVVIRLQVDLQEDDVRRGQIVVHPLGRIAHQHLDGGIVLLEPALQRSADKPASDNPDLDLILVHD